MAEYYHILDYKNHAPDYIAILLSGLRNESRVQMARSGQQAKIEHILLATIADELSGLLYARNGNTEKPQSLLAILINDKSKDEKKCLSFNNSESFKDWWNSH